MDQSHFKFILTEMFLFAQEMVKDPKTTGHTKIQAEQKAKGKHYIPSAP